ncbi:MAG: response regulator transcription factor, partial [Hyphomicrobium sp.]
VVVDDHPLVRRGVRDTINEEPDLEVVGEGSSAEDAVRLAGEAKPDLILLDVTMPGDGLQAAEEITVRWPEIKVAMLTVRDDIGTVGASLRAGARGYISKGTAGPDLIATVRRILRGESYVDPDLAARLLSEGRSVEPAVVKANAGIAVLSEREEQIFALLGRGMSNIEIAGAIGLSENTVKHYITPLLSKLGVRNRVEAALLARERGRGMPPR